MTISKPPVKFASYKWNQKTNSGYIVRLDIDLVRQGLPHCIRIEDWNDRVIVNEWVSDSVDDTVEQLGKLFSLDEAREKKRLQQRFDDTLSQTANEAPCAQQGSLA